MRHTNGSLGFTEFVEYLPGEVRTNSQLPKPIEDIEDRGPGVISRHLLTDVRDTCITVAGKVIKLFFEKMDIKADDCAGLVLATCDIVDERAFKKDVERLAASRGIRGPSIAVQYACSGFVKAVEEAVKMHNPHGKHIIVTTADTANFVNWDDIHSAGPFGAGATATSIIPDGNLSILHPFAQAIDDPKYSIDLRKPDTPTIDVFGNISTDRKVLHMFGKQLLRDVPTFMFNDIKKLLEEADITINDCDAVIPHRASLKLLDNLRERLQKENFSLPVIDKLQEGGNTGSSTIPMTIARLQEECALLGRYLIVAAGAGPHFTKGQLTHGGMIIETN